MKIHERISAPNPPIITGCASGRSPPHRRFRFRSTNPRYPSGRGNTGASGYQMIPDCSTWPGATTVESRSAPIEKPFCLSSFIFNSSGRGDTLPPDAFWVSCSLCPDAVRRASKGERRILPISQYSQGSLRSWTGSPGCERPRPRWRVEDRFLKRNATLEQGYS